MRCVCMVPRHSICSIVVVWMKMSVTYILVYNSHLSSNSFHTCPFAATTHTFIKIVHSKNSCHLLLVLVFTIQEPDWAHAGTVAGFPDSALTPRFCPVPWVPQPSASTGCDGVMGWDLFANFEFRKSFPTPVWDSFWNFLSFQMWPTGFNACWVRKDWFTLIQFL